MQFNFSLNLRLKNKQTGGQKCPPSERSYSLTGGLRPRGLKAEGGKQRGLWLSWPLVLDGSGICSVQGIQLGWEYLIYVQMMRKF